MSQFERSALLGRECAEAESIVRTIVNQETTENWPLSWDESPLKPWIIDQANTLLIYRMKKTAFFYGSLTGTGIMFTRLSTKHPNLIKWSAPLFVKITVRSGGLSLGTRTTSTFAVCTSGEAEAEVTSKSGRRVAGLEFAIGCGAGLQERADILTADFTPGVSTVGVSKVTGTIVDIGIGVGKMEVDVDKNRAAYGDVSPATILHGDMDPPHEFQPLYGELSRIVNRVERPSANPARVSASLERYSAGHDPDRVMVLPDGAVIRQDLAGPPNE